MTAFKTRGVSRSVKALSLCVLALTVATLAAAVEPAQACSCIQPDPWRVLEQADGAFVGRLVSRRESGDGRAILVFSVERAVKGKIGDTVEIETASSGAGCGIEAPVGQRIGLFLVREGDGWFGHLCWQVEPEDLLAAATLPAPNGRGSVALLVGGRFGPARTLALDAKGRTLAYGIGSGMTTRLSLCPGGQRLAEIALNSEVDFSGELAIRDARTLSVIRRQPLRLPGPRYPEELRCEDRIGSRVLVFAGEGGDSPLGKAIYRLAGRRLTAIWQGTAHYAELTATVVYLSAGSNGMRLLGVDPRTGRVTRLGSLPGTTHPLKHDGTGTRLAGVETANEKRSQIVLVDLTRRPARVRTAPLVTVPVYGDIFWLRSGRFLFLPWYGRGRGREYARVFDLTLRTRARFRWMAGDAALFGSTVFGVHSKGALVSAKIPAGPARLVRRLPGEPEAIVSAAG